MLMPDWLTSFLHEYADEITLSLMGVMLLLVLLLLWTVLRLRRLNRFQRKVLSGTNGDNLQGILEEYMTVVNRMAARMDMVEGRSQGAMGSQSRCLQKVGMVRYDAFEEVGGAQSFSLALVDAERSGVVISSVYSRSDVRVYAKAIKHGQPSHPLTAEEQQALAQAEGA
jgi:hypothetical protein